MATAVQMELLYETVLGLDDDQELLLALLDELDTMETYNLLAVEDITRICATICKPGGAVLNVDGDMVLNRGQHVSAVLEKRLKQVWLYFRHVSMTQRLPDFEGEEEVPSLANLANLDVYIKSFALPKDVEKPPQFPGTDKARKWFEQFDKWASSYMGPSGVPLL
jgi:hypothetical protein